jgi:transposase
MYLDGSRKQIIAWVAEGVSDARIAERLRVSASTVRYWRERNGVVRPPRGTAKSSASSNPAPDGDQGQS